MKGYYDPMDEKKTCQLYFDEISNHLKVLAKETRKELFPSFKTFASKVVLDIHSLSFVLIRKVV